MPLPLAIPGIVALSTIMGGLKGAEIGSNISQAKKQMDFQERMSSTAHQREVADLKAAGLNPILSAMKGSGASSPTGSKAEIQIPGEKLMQARLMNEQLNTETSKQTANNATARLADEKRKFVYTEGAKNLGAAAQSNAKAGRDMPMAEIGKFLGEILLQLRSNATPVKVKEGVKKGKKNIKKQIKGQTRKNVKRQFNKWADQYKK